MSRFLASILLVALLCLAQEPAPFRTGVSLVHIDAEVLDTTGPLSGLHKEDFFITDNRVPQRILYFSQDVEPLDLILLFDISGSMRPKLEKVTASSRRALAELSPGDRVAVMTFYTHSAVVAPFTEDLNAVAKTINDDVLRGRFGGGTRLLAGIDDAAEYFLREPRTERRRAVLILTDDYGQRSRRVNTVVHHLWEADALLSGLIIRSPGETAVRTAMLVTSPLSVFIQEGMASVAEKTGGDTIKADDPDDALRAAMRRIRLRYSLYYAMPEGRPGEQRRVTVELSPDAAGRYPGARVRARRGYIVPGPRIHTDGHG
ncbi:MAG TPA: VWA domain-containing protein [Bryobacteraceae bacterium]|nr:VWA domain-containing protein [Bryobacteraceae bacterium]